MNKDCKPVIVDGALLSEEAVNELKALQNCNNGMLNAEIEELSDLVFLLIDIKNTLNKSFSDQIDNCLSTIGLVRNSLISLRIPQDKGGRE